MPMEITIFWFGLISSLLAWIVKTFIFNPLQAQMYRNEISIRELSSSIREMTRLLTNLQVSVATLETSLNATKQRVDKLEHTLEHALEQNKREHNNNDTHSI